MKKILIAALAIATIAGACRKLDVQPESQYTDTNFPKTAADYQALVGPIYTQLASKYAIEYFRMQELTTDEAIIPGRDGNYDDGGQYRQHHHHTYTPDHTNVKDVWSWGFGGINMCNRILNNINSSTVATPDSLRRSAIAEVKTVRALFYFFMLDIYGNVPIVDTFPVLNPPATRSSNEVFQFIENDLKANVNALPAKTSKNYTQVYAHATKGMVHALLAKLYLNARTYTGTERNKDAIAMCDSVIANTNYTLDASYASVFAPNNGPSTTETIFAIPYDPLQLDGQQFTRHGFMAYLYPKYGVPSNLSISMSTTPDFYNRFNLTGDERNDTWLIGKQYNWDGSPFTLTLKKKDLIANWSGTNNDTIWQLEITKDIIMTGAKPFDVGNDYRARCMGVRSVKYYPDPATTAATRMSGNDMPVLRLADIYLMKAEALIRAGVSSTTVNGEVQTPLVLLNKVRTRAKATLASTISLDDLLDERARELYWENWRRNDLIRFDKYETEYPIPGDVATSGYTPGMNKDVRRRVFPIPASEIKLNGNLIQNEAYR
jgi:hypothetical protein